LNIPRFSKVAVGATLALAALLLQPAGIPAGAQDRREHPSAPVRQGRALVSRFRCNGCHGDNLGGRPGFAPNLHRDGILRRYTERTFVRLLLTGITDHGGRVRPPMPVYGRAARRGDRPPGGMYPGGRPGGPPNGPPPGGGPPGGGPPPDEAPPGGGPPGGGPPGGGPPPDEVPPGGGPPGGPPPGERRPGERRRPQTMNRDQAAAIYAYLRTLR
jgi:hypothetical protein